nr:hypothetical protein [Tanacetum cinerariifolium]
RDGATCGLGPGAGERAALADSRRTAGQARFIDAHRDAAGTGRSLAAPGLHRAAGDPRCRRGVAAGQSRHPRSRSGGLLLQRDGGVGQFRLIEHADQHFIEHRRRAPWAWVVQDRDDDPSVAVAVAAEAGNRTDGIQGAGFDVRFAPQGGPFQ